MKYCPTYKRWNQGNPVFCQYCGRTWNYKVCPRGHLNPYNARFCQECGSPDLSEPAEGYIPLGFRLIKPLLWVTVIGLLILISLANFDTASSSSQALIPSLIPIGLLILVIFLIPGGIGRVARRVLIGLIKICFRIVGGILRVLFISKGNKSRG